jgi:hypothetical protein
MELLVSVVRYAIVAAIRYTAHERSVTCEEASLCLTCVQAMVTRGGRARQRGAPWGVDFFVRECTRHRTTESAPSLVRIEGFACERREVYAEIARSP